MKKQIIILSLLLISSLWTALAQETAPAANAEKYTIRRVFKTGEVDRFKAVVNVSGEMMMGENMNMPIDNAVTTIYTIKTAGIKDGIATITTQYEKMTINSNGMEMDAASMGQDLKSMATTQKLNNRGEVIDKSKSAGGGQEAMMQMMGGGGSPGSMMVVFPADPIAIGDSWEVELPNPMKDMLGEAAAIPPIRTRYTLEGIEKVNGKDAFKIKQDMNMVVSMDSDTIKKLSAAQGQPMPFAAMDIQSKSVLIHFIEKATGRTLKTNGQIEGKVVMKMDPSQMENAPPGLSGDLNVNTSAKLAVTSMPPLAPKAPTKAPTTKPKTTPSKPKGKGK